HPRDRGRRHAPGLPRLELAHELPRVRDVDRGGSRERGSAAEQTQAFGVVLGYQVERLAVEDRGLVLGPAELGHLARADEVVDRPARLPGIAALAGGARAGA